MPSHLTLGRLLAAAVAAAAPAVSQAIPPPPAAQVLVVRGTVSTPNAAERNYADKVAQRLTRWLGECDVPCARVDDENLRGGIPAGCRVIVLGYNPAPPAAALAALSRFVAGGGKLIVCYSGSTELASLLGMQLGPYQSGAAGRFEAMRFNGSAPPHLPALVRQSSRNVRPAMAVAGQSAVMATWEGADGRSTGIPAWTLSARGAWMSHVLLEDNDVPAKRRLLLGLAASFDPRLWPGAAAGAATRAARLRPQTDYAEAEAEIRSLAAGAGRAVEADRELRQAAAARSELAALRDSGRYPEAVDRAAALADALARAYGVAQRPRRGEVHGVWDHGGTGLYPGDWDRTCRQLAELGVSDIFANVMWPAEGHYDSRILARSSAARACGDQLKAGTAAARRTGLRFHAWKVCWRLDKAPPDHVAQLRHEGRLQVTDAGEPLDWMCPTHPANRNLELAAIREVASAYDVAGIHLDYIRYRDSHLCFCQGCRARFEQAQGRRVRRWPQDARPGGPEAAAYSSWRAGQIASFVRECRQTVRAANPRLQLSAAVYATHPSCVQSVGQDWVAWLKAGDVDFICPMNYMEDMSQFSRYVTRQADATGRPLAGRILSGLGVSAAESHLTPVQVIDQVRALRGAGQGGFVLFDLNPALVADTLPVLRLGITAPGN